MANTHSERCIGANRFGDGFDCICDEEPLPKALARIEQLERELAESQRLCAAAGTELARKERERADAITRAAELEEEKQQAEQAERNQKYRADDWQRVAGGISKELNRIMGQIEGYRLGLTAFKANPNYDGVAADDVIAELGRIIEHPKRMSEPLRVPELVRKRRGLGPVILAAELVANQWELGDVPSESSLDTLSRAMRLYSVLDKAIADGLAELAPTAVCNEHIPNEERPLECAKCGKPLPNVETFPLSVLDELADEARQSEKRFEDEWRDLDPIRAGESDAAPVTPSPKRRTRKSSFE